MDFGTVFALNFYCAGAGTEKSGPVGSVREGHRGQSDAVQERMRLRSGAESWQNVGFTNPKWVTRAQEGELVKANSPFILCIKIEQVYRNDTAKDCPYNRTPDVVNAEIQTFLKSFQQAVQPFRL